MVGAWHVHGIASVNQTRPHYVNQMGRHILALSCTTCQGNGMGTAWEWHAMCESVFAGAFPHSLQSNVSRVT